MKYLKDLNAIEKRAFFNSFDLVFCDCDGVIWHDLHKLIPGSGEAINYLRQQWSKKVTFVTNNTIIKIEDQVKKFHNINVKCEEHDLIHPALVISDYLKQRNFQGLLLCYVPQAFREYITKQGFQLAAVPEKFIGNDVKELWNAIHSNDPVKAVVIDVDFNLTPWKIIRAQRHLKNPDCLFIGGAADPLIPLANLNAVGPGVFINLIAETCGRTPIILGKPGQGLKDYLNDKFNINDSKRVLFIGDSLKSDIKFGNLAGYQTLLVLTGAITSNDLKEPLKPDENAPDYVIDSLKDLTNLL